MDMNEQVHTSYDTVGSSSYLTMALPDEVKVVHYRLEMLTSNEITQLLQFQNGSWMGKMFYILIFRRFFRWNRFWREEN